MKTIDQLLAKAMSTSSEDEAIACLRMARKKGGNTEPTNSSSGEDVYNGHNAKYWYEKANVYYQKLKQKPEKPAGGGLSLEQQSILLKMYENAEKQRVIAQENLYRTQTSLNQTKQLLEKSKEGKTFDLFIFGVILVVGVSIALFF